MNHLATTFRELCVTPPESHRFAALIERLERQLDNTPTAVGVISNRPRCLSGERVTGIIDLLSSRGVSVTARPIPRGTVVLLARGGSK